MSALQGHERDGSGSDGAPDAKRQRLDDQENAPDPTKITIKIEGHAQSFVVNRQTAIENCLYFEAVMGEGWENSRTGIVVLQESDGATPDTIEFLQRYFEYLEDVALNAGTDEELLPDPLDDLEDFGGLANFWLLADFLQSQKITNAVMEEFETRAGDFELLTEEMFEDWWAVLEDQPAYDMLRGAMVALFVASDAFKDDNSRHTMMPRLPAAAQVAIVDELVRQHKDVHDEFSHGADELEEYLDDEGLKKLDSLRGLVTNKVPAGVFEKSYTNRRDRD